ncbi:hypothetical protein [Sinorhizobium mexicanum]|uniref:Uncharacterized protein n=1 Tax=Sinorhizobium mexicanum TaxID=375549 RepID=A0A859QRL8_9HYPH|nr:hypothetical protein [Sinorhizobium mexicanum]MBP1882395.1 hypothetical protein [Sinorhizobium mexicanum]QLL62099.1 hypothetical protein FKV68_11850 [Sinorhizobium mexicanum]
MKKIGFAFDAVVGLILNILDLLIFEFLLHRTARIVVPLVSFGRVKVEEIYTDDIAFNWLGFKRLPSGPFLLSSTMSKFAGALFWLLCLVAYLSFTRGV